MLVRASEVLGRVYAAYDEFSFHKVYRNLYNFATVDLSAFYFDIIKDRLYTYPAGSQKRRAAQSVLYWLGEALVRALSPLLCFTTTRCGQVMPKMPPRKDHSSNQHPGSVHMAEFVPTTELVAGLSKEQRAKLETGRG